ncbi:MAG TPA: type IV pilus secretin PilQ [Terriglobales bacterium]|nr:type IV pilus secretin PilQ [Terriglobales bacterium]
MRLKQLLSVGLAVPLLTAFAVAESQLTAISVQKTADAATVTVRANGALIHNEYRPIDNLLLVDFPGTGTGTLDSASHSVSVPGIFSYQVHAYKSANGSEIARVELTVDPHAVVRFTNENSAIVMTVTTSGAAKTISAKPSALPQTASSAAPVLQRVAMTSTRNESESPSVASKILELNDVSVVRGHNSTDIEIRANGVLTPKILRLKSPDRIVIDLANTVPEWNTHSIPVHSGDIEMVRMSRYQENPPTTRVVVDLKSPQSYELASFADKLVLKLHPIASTAAPVRTAPPYRAAEHTEVAENASPSKKANDFVVLHPEYHHVAQAAQDDKTADPVSPAVKAAEAARILGATAPVEIPLSTTPAAEAMKPETMKAAMMQAAAQAPASTTAARTAAAMGSTASCNTGRYTGEPISVNLKDVDLKDFFRLIHDISGLNVVLDPGVSGSLTIVLDDVPWDQALAIVLQNNSLQCQLNGNVLRIALPETLRREADALRATEEAQALAVNRVTVTRYLSYATAKAVVPTLKAFLSKRGDIISDDRTNSIIVQDIPSVIPGIDRLLKELDRKTQQVEIEARVVAATRQFARDLGTQFGFGVANGSSVAAGAAAAGFSPTSVFQPGVNGAPGSNPLPNRLIQNNAGQIPLFSNIPAGPAVTSGLTLLTEGHNYRIDTILTAAESRGLLKILSRPRVVTQNNAMALVRQGVRIPVVTAAQLGGPPTTAYVDAFLRLQVTPQITAEGTIFLNVDVENTVPNFAITVLGNPELQTQQATTQVLVSDGGTVVIGGVIQTNDNIQYQQVPFLGNIPVFGNLFKRKSVSTTTQELIFFITPRIVQS